MGSPPQPLHGGELFLEQLPLVEIGVQAAAGEQLGMGAALEHLAAVEMFPRTDHPTEGAIRIVRPPVRFGEADCALRRPAPRLGEHSREILREAGFADDKIADLLDRKVAIDAVEL